MFSLLRALPRSTAFTLAAFAALLPSSGGAVPNTNTGVAPVLVPYTVNVLAGNSQNSVGGYAGEGVLATNATLNGPSTLAVDSVGNLYISDQSNALIREVNAQTGIIKTIAGQAPTKCTGTVCTTINAGCADGVVAVGSQVGSRVQGLVVDGFGNVFFSDYNYQGAWVIYHGGAQVASFINLVDASGVTTAGGVKPGYVYHIAGLATPKAGGGCTTTSGTVDQVLATQASFHDPLQLGIDAAGNLYIQDYANDVVRIINTQATTQTFFGVSIKPGFVAAAILCSAKLTTVCPASAAPFGGPVGQALFSTVLQGLTTDQFGNVYQLDGKGTPAVNYAGVAYAGGSALGHLINLESGLVASPGNWYQVINNGSSPNALTTAVQAVFAKDTNNIVLRPDSMAVDLLGNLYMMDYHWISIYRVDINNGMATRLNGLNGGTPAGTLAAPTFCSGTSGPQTYDAYGDGCNIALAKFNGAGTGYVTFDGAGNLYIADLGNNIVRKVSLGTTFPATAMGSPTTQTLQLHFDPSNLPAGGTPFKITSPDFTLNGTPTCANYTLGLDASTECYVSVTFTPSAPGARAATLQATTANGSVYPFPLTGFGNGARIALDGGTPATVAVTGLGSPAAVATDAAGDVYVADANNNQVILLPANGGAQTTVGTGLKMPQGVAVDAQGDVYIADAGNNRIVEISATTGAQTVLTSNVSNPQGLAIDPLGNLYVADTGNARIVEISPFGELAPSPLLAYAGAQALVKPVGIAIDKLGNLYVADAGNSSGLIEITAGGGDLQAAAGSSALASPTKIVSFGTAFVSAPSGVAIDAAGNLYVSDGTNNAVEEIPSATGPGSEPFVMNFPGLKAPGSLALDSGGNLYVADTGNGRVLLDNRANLALNFGTAYVHQTPGTIPLTITNIGSTPYAPTAPFAAVAGANAGDFSESDTCSAANFPLGTLAAGLHCSFTPTFTPTTTGTRAATLSVQNGAATLSLTGIAVFPQALVTLAASAPGGLVANQNATVTATVTQPTSATLIPSGGQLTFSYTVNGVATALPSVTLPASGVTSFNLPTLLLGRQYVISASYSGDLYDSAANATPLSFYVPGLPLTVTASSLSYTYGGTVPQATGTVTGILPADQASVHYSFVTTATSSSPVGAYPITVSFSGGNYQNYGFPPVYNADGKTPAVITETQAPLTVAVNNTTSPYGANNVTFTSTATGVVNGDKLVITYTPAQSQYLNVGTYTVVPSVSSPPATGSYDKINNYKLTLVNGVLNVVQTGSVVAVAQPLKAVLPTALTTSALTFTAGPATLPTYGTPTGTLTLQDTFTPLTATGSGPTVSEPAIVLPLVKGVATYTPTDPTLGTHVYTAAYSGDANFQSSSTSSSPNTLIVDVADFTVVSTNSPIQVAPGIIPGGNAAVAGEQAATPEQAPVVIAPILGSTATVNLTCTSPVSYLTCTIAPTSLTLNGTASQTATVSLSTPLTLPLGFTAALKQDSRNVALAFLPLALFTLLPLCAARRRSLRAGRLLGLLLGVALLAGLSGCGGNLVQFFTPVPAGQQQVTVTGTSGSVSRSFVVTVDVQ